MSDTTHAPTSYTFQLCRERQHKGPWVCVDRDCDEALPPAQRGRSCPRCGSDMIRSPYSLIVARETDPR